MKQTPQPAAPLPDMEHRYVHPLEAFRFFRRFRPSIARNLLYTLLICCVATLFFATLGWVTATPEVVARFPTRAATFWSYAYVNVVFSLCVGFSMHIFAVSSYGIVRRWFHDASGQNYFRGGIIGTVVGGLVGYALALHLLQSYLIGVRADESVLLTAALILGIIIAQRRRLHAELQFERERAARVEAERLTMASRLRMLQAQIEPHFLFNTLANVSSLIEVEPKQARKMLDDLTVLLRASLDSTRLPTISLRRELQVIDSYLAVLKVRMGSRLGYRIDAPPELLDIEVPAMLLQPIVENAVKHGIERRVAGGSVRVEVSERDSQLELAVLDDGVGFAPTSKDSVGLGAVRERLAVQFGAQAQLHIQRTPEHWTRVAIRIPMPA
jgi:sensor histidine kinase YesM